MDPWQLGRRTANGWPSLGFHYGNYLIMLWWRWASPSGTLAHGSGTMMTHTFGYLFHLLPGRVIFWRSLGCVDTMCCCEDLPWGTGGRGAPWQATMGPRSPWLVEEGGIHPCRGILTFSGKFDCGLFKSPHLNSQSTDLELERHVKIWKNMKHFPYIKYISLFNIDHIWAKLADDMHQEREVLPSFPRNLPTAPPLGP